MRVVCLLFGAARSETGLSQLGVELPNGLVAELWASFAQNPKLAPLLDSCILAVNQDYVQPEAHLQLKETDEIALIPPLSGG
jgi:molybdopterin converting factor small subunit